MRLPPDLERQLADLEGRLPVLIEANPDQGDFWMAFAGEADVIEDRAGGHTDQVSERIAAMLAEHGRYIAEVPMVDEENEKPTDLQQIAGAHAAVNGALTKAIRQAREGGELPWEEMEEAIKIAIDLGGATAADLAAVKNKEMNVDRWREILAAVKSKYGNPPKLPGKM
jgi:hypothetical protein